MANPLYQQLGGGSSNNPMIQRLMQFKKGFSGNPKDMVQNMLNSGKVSQAQINQYAKQADEIYKALGGKF